MSTVVMTELLAQPGRGQDVADLLLDILDESLEHKGCEVVRVIRDQDDADHVAGLTQWAELQDYSDCPRAHRSGVHQNFRIDAHATSAHPLLRRALLR